MRNKDFAVFILTHGRADRVRTYQTLKKQGYTGRIYLVIDNEDKEADEYYDRFGDEVIMFDKLAIARTHEEADNFGDRRSVFYARNACFQIAEELGISYFMEFDDDYNYFSFRINSRFQYVDYALVKSLDDLFDSLLDFYISIDAKSVAVAQTGDYIGGAANVAVYGINHRRKSMNTMICSTKRPYKFVGRVNEDVNTYTWFQGLGNLFITCPLIAMNQVDSQANPGGMTEMYLDGGTYLKSFYTVIFCPGGVKVAMMHSKYPRLHHSVRWENTVPCIIEEKYRETKS
jgi:hypothetical protein